MPAQASTRTLDSFDPDSVSVPVSTSDPGAAKPTPSPTDSPSPTLTDLLAAARAFAADADLVAQVRRLDAERSWIALDGPFGSEAWLIAWPPGAETGWHDHGGSIGAFVTAAGLLHESSLAAALPGGGWRSLELEPGLDRERDLPAGTGRGFGPHHVHQVVNPSPDEHAVSVHVYYPPLPLIRRYSRRGRVLGLETVELPEAW